MYIKRTYLITDHYNMQTSPPPSYHEANLQLNIIGEPPPQYPREGIRICTRSNTATCLCETYPSYHSSHYDDQDEAEIPMDNQAKDRADMIVVLFTLIFVTIVTTIMIYDSITKT